jgi:hypothetical protein
MRRLHNRAMHTPELAETPAGKLMTAGGIDSQEYIAAEKAIEETRKKWLPILEGFREREFRERVTQKEPSSDDLLVIAFLDEEIQRLRRLLRLGPSPELVREQTRERVQRFRQRQRDQA